MRRVEFRIRSQKAINTHDPLGDLQQRRWAYRTGNEPQAFPRRRCPHGVWNHAGRWYFAYLWPDGSGLPQQDPDPDVDDACPRCLLEDLKAGTATICNPTAVEGVLELVGSSHEDAPTADVAEMLRGLLEARQAR